MDRDTARWGSRAELFARRARRRANFLLTAAGLRRKGFFTPYDYLADVPPLPDPYPEVADLFDARRDRMLGFLSAMSQHLPRFAARPAEAPRPRWGSRFMPPLDGAAIYTQIARSAPTRVVEVGSGNSTVFMARAVLDHGLSTAITCIDPAPRIPVDGLPVTLRRRTLSAADLPLVDALGRDDVLFVDSSHILQQGFDLDIILNRMLPRLASGVVVHFHDIFLPHPYPAHWDAFRFNEQNALIGWILSGAFDPLFASHHALHAMPRETAALIAALPGPDEPRGGSLWLRRN